AAARGVYVDGFHDGHQSGQISQQTNALAVTSGVCPPEREREVLTRILDPNDAKLCRCGTYFWTYLAEALCQAGMHREVWSEVVRLWGDMAERGATTWWETFLGDELDSLCHIWSSVPGYLLLAEVLGVKPARPGFTEITIRPRVDLLSQAEGLVPIRDGEIELEWSRTETECCLTARNGTDALATIEPPGGWTFAQSHASRIALPAGQLAVLQIVTEE
ncbi:MAG: hypothetical protein HY318_04575, partial [Armatimonadetes bacterium]|nr:hypothetical protein [Armatimonadota bacterium]